MGHTDSPWIKIVSLVCRAILSAEISRSASAVLSCREGGDRDTVFIQGDTLFFMVPLLKVLIQAVNFTAHSLRSLEAQSTQRIYYLFLLLSTAKVQRDVNRGEKK